MYQKEKKGKKKEEAEERINADIVKLI